MNRNSLERAYDFGLLLRSHPEAARVYDTFSAQQRQETLLQLDHIDDLESFVLSLAHRARK